MMAGHQVSKNGMLSAFQVGPADTISSISAANSAWGWIGGLNGVRQIFSLTRKPHSDSFDQLVRRMSHAPITCKVLTSNGIVMYEDFDAQAFGGTPETQLLGQTLCALAHVCDGPLAVHLFMLCLAPQLFPGDENMAGMREALRVQLNENYQKILNEGSTRSLTQLFTKALEKANLGDKSIYTTDHKESKPIFVQHMEGHMIGGLLTWLGEPNKKVYYTRSSLVAKAAVCLRAVGYSTGHILVWKGDGVAPDIPKGVVLVLGGTIETDPMVADDLPYLKTTFFQHYRFETVGAMFLNGLPHTDHTCYPETYQTMFDNISEQLVSNLKFEWKMVHEDANEGLQASPKWNKAFERPRAEARTLASIYFTNSADRLAPFYNSIAHRKHIEAVLNSIKNSVKKPLTEEVVKFRVITASIVFAIAAILGGEGFNSLRHVTAVDLHLSPLGWFRGVIELLDKGLNDCLSLKTAIDVVAVVHAGATPAMLLQSEIDSSVVGYRNGIYSVLPSLLFKMKPCKEALGLQCVDEFYGTIPVHQDNYIRSVKTAKMNLDIDTKRPLETDTTMKDQAWIGRAEVRTPDVGLYLSIERTTTDTEPNVALAGRIKGELIGFVTIQSVLEVLSKSFESALTLTCKGHASYRDVFNIQTSFWATKWNQKPYLREYISHISAGSDHCWALFLAGQIDDFSGYISFTTSSCLECLLPEDEKAFFICVSYIDGVQPGISDIS